MNLSLTPEQEGTQESFRRLFVRHCPPSLVRQYKIEPQSSTIAELWRNMSSTGLLGLGLPEEYGGYGDVFDLGLAFMEGGRVICPTLFYSTAGFGQAVLRLGTAAQHQAWLPGVASGDTTGSLALWNPSDASDVRPRLAATRVGQSWRLNGQLEFVSNADNADALVVTARTSPEALGRTLAFIATKDQSGVSVERMRTMASDSQCVVQFTDVLVDPANVLGAAGADLAEADLRWLSNAMTALQTLEMMGGAQAVIDRTVEYVIGRIQFDRPLASFQAVQHHVANMHIAVEGARLAAYQAAWWTSKGMLAEREVALAKLKSGEAYKFVSLTAHQLHGGMGYMREFDLHLWTERAKATELLGGPAAVQSRRLERALQLAD